MKILRWLLRGVLALAALVALLFLGPIISNIFSNVANQL